MAILITNIKQLVNVREESKLLRGKELSVLPTVENAYMIVEKGLIGEYGSMQNIKHQTSNFKQTIDATGQFILPCWCDSHTHLVFAASREEEFVDKIRGISYEEIAAKGGGILNSAKKLKAVSEDELLSISLVSLNELIKLEQVRSKLKAVMLICGR
jgi:imidazolonepropionase